MAEVALSQVEAEFVRALGEARADGRAADEPRSVRVTRFRSQTGAGQARCEVHLGETHVAAFVQAQAVEPFQDRPSEGIVKLSVALSALAREDIEPRGGVGTANDGAEAKLQVALEHAVLETRAIDLEGLCILSGRKVWCVQVDVSVLNDAGNVLDCACVAAFGALAHYRRPDVSVVGDVVTVHSLEERVPVPLSLHHTPMCVTFGLFTERGGATEDGGRFYLLDMSDREELACDGRITVIVNAHKEVCGIHKHGWPPLESEQLAVVVAVAAERAPELAALLVAEEAASTAVAAPSRDEDL